VGASLQTLLWAPAGKTLLWVPMCRPCCGCQRADPVARGVCRTRAPGPWRHARRAHPVKPLRVCCPAQRTALCAHTPVRVHAWAAVHDLPEGGLRGTLDWALNLKATAWHAWTLHWCTRARWRLCLQALSTAFASAAHQEASSMQGGGLGGEEEGEEEEDSLWGGSGHLGVWAGCAVRAAFEGVQCAWNRRRCRLAALCATHTNVLCAWNRRCCRLAATFATLTNVQCAWNRRR